MLPLIAHDRAGFGGALISLAREISDQPPAREMDMLLSTGEQQTISDSAMPLVERMRAHTDLPLAMGFDLALGPGHGLCPRGATQIHPASSLTG